MKNMTKLAAGIAFASGAMAMSSAAMADVTANASVTNNYIWRGLTQSINEGAIQGGIDYSNESGFYAGTWASNVSYDSDDAYSYEHDMYAGFSGETDTFSYDIGYLYYNYDKNANFDFGEVYGSIGVGGFSASLSLLANTEADEAPDQDFGFGQTYYGAIDYAFPVGEKGTEIALHLGYHDGDFADAFNGVTKGYVDYNVTVSNGGFAFMVSGTNLGDDDNNDGFEDYASMSARDNDNVKFVLSYGLDFEL